MVSSDWDTSQPSRWASWRRRISRVGALLLVLGLLAGVVYLMSLQDVSVSSIPCTPEGVRADGETSGTTPPDTPADDVQTVTLSPASGAASSLIAFGPRREPRGMSLLLTSSGSIPDLNEVTILSTDLSREDGVAEIVSESVSSSAEAIEPNVVRIRICIDPGQVPAGTYMGQLRVVGSGVDAYAHSITAELKRPAWFGVPWLGAVPAFLAILLGAVVGTVLKWLTESAADLSALLKRADNLRTRLSTRWVPEEFLIDLRIVETQIEQGDATGAQNGIEEFAKKVPALLRLSGSLGWLYDQVTTQERDIIDRRFKARADYGSLKLVHRHELIALDRLTLGALEGLEAAETKATQLQDAVSAFTSFLGNYEDKKSAPLDDVVAALGDEQYETAASSLRDKIGRFEKAQAGDQVALPPESPPSEGFSSDYYGPGGSAAGLATGWGPAKPPSLIARLKGLVFDYQRGVTTVLVMLAVCVAGLQLLYFDNPTYGKNAGDILALVGWGFAVQVTGVTVTQVGSHFTGRTPGLG